MADEKAKAVTKDSIVLAQTEYKGNSHFDTEDVKFIKDSDFYKEGDTDTVHPTVAAIFREKGLIK